MKYAFLKSIMAERRDIVQPIIYLFPSGGDRAVTFSYDDGREHDRRLVEIFNRYELKGTFHLNTGTLGKDGFIHKDEIQSLYTGHEIASHTMNHPFLSQQPPESILSQILKDRAELEQLAGYPVRGFSYPFGDAGGNVPSMLKAAGIDYARTVMSTNGFSLPDNFLLWNPTCHDNDAETHVLSFKKETKWNQLRLLYIWGHSYEFEDNNRWDKMQQLCQTLNGVPNVWRATNGEIMDYLSAIRGLRWSTDGSMVVNPSAIDVFIKQNDSPMPIRPGLNHITN